MSDQGKSPQITILTVQVFCVALIGFCSDCLWVLLQSRLDFESPPGHSNIFIGSSRQRSITKEAMAHMFPLPYGPGGGADDDEHDDHWD